MAVVWTAHTKWALCRLTWAVQLSKAPAVFAVTTHSTMWNERFEKSSVEPEDCTLFLCPGNEHALHFGLSFFPNLVEEELWRKASISSFC